MSKNLIWIYAFIFMMLSVLIIGIFIQPYSLLRLIKGKRAYAAYLIQKAGGVEKVNQEAMRIFDIFYATGVNMDVLLGQDFAQYPVISRIGDETGATINRSKENIKNHIIVKYGTHMMPDFIYIFDKRDSPSYFLDSGYDYLEQIEDNIYLRK